MNLGVNGTNIIYILLTTFIASIILVPIIKKVAFHINALDYPNQRRTNKVPMPTLGGIAIFFSFLLGYILFARSSVEMIAIIIACFILIFVGLVDDIKPISAKYQFIGQIIGCLVIILYGKISIDNFTVLGMHLVFPSPLKEIVTLIFMLGIINAIDLSDGLDGLCSGISCIYFITITIIAILLGNIGGIDTTISLLMIGSLLGFLVYNFPPAKLYLGDSGSNFIGLMIATTAILGFKLATFTSLLIPLAILATPIIDVMFSIIRRGLQKKNPFTTPDKEHLHHQLLKLEFSKRFSLLIIYIINILFSIVSILYAIGSVNYAISLYICLMVIFLFIVLKTDILFPRRKESSHAKNKRVHK